MREPVVGGVDLALHLGQHFWVRRQILEGQLDAVAVRPRRCGVGVEHDQRRNERPVVTDRARLTDQLARLQGRFQVRRRDVLAPRGDDQLLLAIDDPQVSGIVERADVAAVEPAVGVEHLGGLRRIVEVAAEHIAAAAAHLAVGIEAHFDARHGRADRSDADLVRLPRHRTRCLRQPVDLRQRQAHRAEEAQHLERDRCRARHTDDRLVEADEALDEPQRRLHERELLGQLAGRLRAPRPQFRHLPADFERAVKLFRLRRIDRDRGPQARVGLLPHARHGEERLRPHRTEVQHHLSRVRARGDLERRRDPEVVRRHAFRDVRHRQVRHRAPARFDVDGRAVALDGPHDVGVIEHHTLRRPGRTRRVDDRREIGRLRESGGGVEIDRRVRDEIVPVQHACGYAGGRHVDDGDRAQRGKLCAHRQKALEVGAVLDNRGNGTAVSDEILDLIGCGRVVDRDRCRATQHHRDVGDVKLRAVAHQQHDPVAVTDTQLSQRAREARRTVGVFTPCPLGERVTHLPPQRDFVAVRRDRLGELPGHRVTHRMPPPRSPAPRAPRRCRRRAFVLRTARWPACATGARSDPASSHRRPR